MNFLYLLETMVILFFIYLILSLVSSSILEFIQAGFGWRSDFLENAIGDMLQYPELTKLFYEHPLIKVTSGETHRKPAYIQADVFAKVVFDLLLQQAREARGDSERDHPSNDPPKPEFDLLYEHVNKMVHHPQLRGLLLVILDGSDGSLATARLGLEDVFNETLDRAAGVYRRKVQVWAAGIVAGITILFNVDTLSIFQWGLGGSNGQIPLGWSAAVLPQSLYQWSMKIAGLLITITVVTNLTPALFSLGRLISQKLRGRSRREREIDAKIEMLGTTKAEDVQKLAATQIKLLDDYHKIVLDQSRKSFWSALVAAIVGLAFFLGAVGFVMSAGKTEAAILSALAGALVEVISGINFALYSKTTAQMAEFQTRLDMTQRFLLANSICENLEKEFRQNTRSQLVLMIAQTAPGNMVLDQGKK